MQILMTAALVLFFSIMLTPFLLLAINVAVMLWKDLWR